MKTVSGILVILLGVSSTVLAGEAGKKASLIIDPKMRSLDYLQAYDALRKEKPSNKICITLLDGSVFSNIIEMQQMTNNTLFLVRYNSPQGVKLQAIELELIQSIGYLE